MGARARRAEGQGCDRWPGVATRQHMAFQGHRQYCLGAESWTIGGRAAVAAARRLEQSSRGGALEEHRKERAARGSRWRAR